MTYVSAGTAYIEMGSKLCSIILKIFLKVQSIITFLNTTLLEILILEM